MYRVFQNSTEKLRAVIEGIKLIKITVELGSQIMYLVKYVGYSIVNDFVLTAITFRKLKYIFIKLFTDILTFSF